MRKATLSHSNLRLIARQQSGWAMRGVLPRLPALPEPTPVEIRKALARIFICVQNLDLHGLRNDRTQPQDAAREAICRYRDDAIFAITFRKWRGLGGHLPGEHVQ
jgi:hypothetical protein